MTEAMVATANLMDGAIRVVRAGTTSSDMLKMLVAEAERMPRMVGRRQTDPATGRSVCRWTLAETPSRA